MLGLSGMESGCGVFTTISNKFRAVSYHWYGNIESGETGLTWLIYILDGGDP